MKKYYFNDGTGQQGPFTLEELQAKNITASTPVWYDGLPDWTTAGQLEELNGILVHTPPPFHAVTPAVVEEVKPVTTVPAATVAETTVSASTATVAATAAPAPATKKPASAAKKSTAWLSYVALLLVLGGVGFLVYQDMEKNKENKNGGIVMTPGTDTVANTNTQQPATEQPMSTMTTAEDTSGTVTTTATTTEPTTTTTTTTPTTTTTTTVTPTTTQPVAVTTTKPTKPVPAKPTPAEIKAKQAEAQKLAQKKADEEKKKLQAAQAAQAALAAAAAREKDYRNNWSHYITFGKIDFNANGDGIDAFNVPVYNGTNAMLDKVTVRVDYMKKDKKVLKSETIFVYNVPPGAGLNGKAPEYKKGNNVKVFITGITSRKLHFCFPSNSGNPGDPYFCN